MPELSSLVPGGLKTLPLALRRGSAGRGRAQALDGGRRPSARYSVEDVGEDGEDEQDEQDELSSNAAGPAKLAKESLRGPLPHCDDVRRTRASFIQELCCCLCATS